MNRLRFHILAGLWAAIVSAGVPAHAAPPADLQNAGNAIGEFMLRLYSNDRPGAESLSVPHSEIGLLVGQTRLTDAERAQVREELSGLGLMQGDPFRRRGRNVAPDRRGEYPVETQATFMTQFRGVQLVIPVVKTAAGWKVDVRYWIAMQKPCDESDPEVVTRKFLYFLIARKENELQEVVTQGGDLRSLLEGRAPHEDQYYCLAMEMPVVEAREGEGMPLAKGGVIEAQRSSDRWKWFVGMYGPHQLVFELKREESGWRVVPRDYLSVIGIGRHASPEAGKLEEVRVILSGAVAPLPPPAQLVPPAAPPSADRRDGRERPSSSASVAPPRRASVRQSQGSVAAIGLGATMAEVVATLGNPDGKMTMGPVAIWSYSDGTVEFEGNEVVSVKLSARR